MAIYLYVTSTVSNFRHNIIFISACYVSLLQLYSKKDKTQLQSSPHHHFPEEKHRPDSEFFIKDMRIYPLYIGVYYENQPTIYFCMPMPPYIHMHPDTV